jgi:outer membrane lipoprotein-sorting protein
MYRSIAVALVLASSCVAGQPQNASQPTRPAAVGATPAQDLNSVRVVLDKLQSQVGNLKSYQCKIDYVFAQPLFDSTERRKGTLQYARIGDRSYLYIDFTSLQYDKEKEQKYREQYLFDGVWLTYVDHKGLSVQRRQIAEANAPVDAFALASRKVPIMGFAKVEDLEKQFDIERVSRPPNDPNYELHMTVKPDSVYKDDYKMMDVQVDKKQGLPVKIRAVTPKPDQNIYEIYLTDARIDENVPKSTFEISYPKDYPVETVPLEKTRPPKGQP